MNLLQKIICDEVILNPVGSREESIVEMIKGLVEENKNLKTESLLSSDLSDEVYDLEENVSDLEGDIDTYKQKISSLERELAELINDNMEADK